MDNWHAESNCMPCSQNNYSEFKDLHKIYKYKNPYSSEFWKFNSAFSLNFVLSKLHTTLFMMFTKIESRVPLSITQSND